MWKHIRTVAASLAAGIALALTGQAHALPQAAPDVPPAKIIFFQGRPVGLTGFKWTNELSYSFQSYDRMDQIRSESPLRLLGFEQNRRDPNLTLEMEADRRIYFKADISNWSASCTNSFSFVPTSGGTYFIRPTLSEDGSCTAIVTDTTTQAPPPSLEARP